jgi:hypothetical protein
METYYEYYSLKLNNYHTIMLPKYTCTQYNKGKAYETRCPFRILVILPLLQLGYKNEWK